ncbi:MAG: hypothetical protein IAA31_04420 [Candidatus Anaerobiospirillum merdipullorum]|uniref:Uncharacterized protein n=1 Tax=Candidatus Anaerobiospirillum merdipullorum TaxID=2838450 RepID=A0A9E2KMM3_9GAMM|nr:hypothetical protein [Candidatus Anaerobiospirillum merdipullorum]
MMSSSASSTLPRHSFMRVVISLFAGSTAVMIPSSHGQIASFRNGLDDIMREVCTHCALSAPQCRALLQTQGLNNTRVGRAGAQALGRLFLQVRALLLPLLNTTDEMHIKIIGANFPGLTALASQYLCSPQLALSVEAIDGRRCGTPDLAA